ncbi:MAG: hypothetical protein JWR26_3762 [Pedosphaera sp.]|nr:hypothetical protein [Pedosphaera sp.]
MKKLLSVPAPFWVAFCFLVAFMLAGVTHAAEPLRIETQLIWGTNDPQSPDPKHKPIDAVMAKKLDKSPYKWKNYFEVNRQVVEIAPGETKKNIKMSDRCTVDIKNLGDDHGRVEVTLHGDGKVVSRHVEPLPDNWPLILAGDAKNDTAWLVSIKKLEPKEKKSEKPATK